MAAQHSGSQCFDASTIDKLQDWQSTQASTASDMLEDSCWTDLPDLSLTDSSGLQSELFASEFASSQSPSMFDLAEADYLLPARMNDTLFSDYSESLTGMDLDTILADHDCMQTSTPDKQLQPRTPSAPNNHLDDFLQQLHPPRSCCPASRETEQRESAATPFHEGKLIPERPAGNPIEISDCPIYNQCGSMTAGQVSAVPSAKPQRVKKTPKIIVRLNIPASKKKTKGAQGRTSPRLAEKLPAATAEESEALLPVAKTPASVQQKRPLVMHEATHKSASHDVSTQTDFPSESSSSKVPLFTSAQALAEGTKLLLAAPGGTFTSHQHAMQMPAGFTTAPWTLLTQSNIQLRLKPTVAAAGTQTEACSQSDQPPASTVAIINNAAAGHDTPMRHTEAAHASTAQHAASTAAQLRPSQTSLPTKASRTPVSPIKKKSGAQKRLSPSRIARHASHYRLSPNAHFMFQCQGGAAPYALPLPQDSPKPHHHCLTPVRTSEKVKCRPNSLSCLSPPATAVTHPAADAATDHPSNSPAAVLAADPSEIQLPDGNKKPSSCKSPLPVRSASGPVKRPSKAQPVPEALDPSNSASLGRPMQSAKAAALCNPSGISTAKPASISPPGQSHIADNGNSAADAATNATASAAAGPTASHGTRSSKAPAEIDSASRHTIVTVSPQSMLDSVIDHPASAAQNPAQVHGQEHAQPMTPVAPVHKAPSQPAAAHPALHKTPSAPRAPEASRPLPKTGAARAQQDQDQAAAAAPGNPAAALGPTLDTPSHKAAALSQQGKQHVMPQPSTIPSATAVAATSPRAVVCSKRKSTIPFRSRAKSQVDAEAKELKTKELVGALSPCTAETLRSDLVSTAGCHVTRRLVQHLLEPIPPPASGVRASSQPVRDAAETAGRNKSKVQPAACPGKGRAGGHSQAPQAGRLPSSGTSSPGSGEANDRKQPPQAGTASGAPAAILSKGKAPNADQSKKTGKDKQHHPGPQHSKQCLPPSTDEATKPTATHVELESKHARLPRSRAGKTRSTLELNQQQARSGAAITSPADKQKPGNGTAADNQPAASANLINSSTADKQEARGSNTVTQSAALPAPASMPSCSVGQSKEPKPTTSATQQQSGLKRLPSDASAASAPAKKHKSACATAAGLNPKFMATKNEVLRLIGEREGVLEAELRRSMGNNPDTSKALRKLLKEGALQRSGAGGRPDPFKWTKTSES